MSESDKFLKKEGAGERSLRFLRDINAIGALAVAGIAAAIPGPNVLLASYAALNAGQAGFYEIARQGVRSRKKNG